MTNFIFVLFYGTFIMLGTVLSANLERGFEKIAQYFNWKIVILCLVMSVIYFFYGVNLIEFDSQIFIWCAVALFVVILYYLLNRSRYGLYAERTEKVSNKDDSLVKKQISKIDAILERYEVVFKILSVISLLLAIVGLLELVLDSHYKEHFLNYLEVDYQYVEEEEIRNSGSSITGEDKDAILIETYLTSNKSLQFFVNELLHYIVKLIYVVPYFTLLLAAGYKD